MTSSVHPLFGRLLWAIGFRRRQGVLLLVVVLPDGAPGTIAASATDLLGAQAEDALVGVLDLDGIRRLREIVGTLKTARRSTSGAKTRK